MHNTEVTLPEYRGLSNELLKNLSGPSGRWWLNRLKTFLRKENPWDIQSWEEWQTIEYGDFANSKWLKNICSRHGHLCGEAYHVLKNIKTTEEHSSVQLQVAPLSMLGIEGWYSIDKANTRIRSLGFELLTPEMIFHLHRQYDARESLYIAMEPITIHDGKSFVFCLARTSMHSNSLVAFYNHATNLMSDPKIVFAKRLA